MNLNTKPTGHIQSEPACLSVDELVDYAVDKLPAESKAVVEHHLQNCEFCRDALEGIGALPQKERARILTAALNEEIRQRSAVTTDKRSLLGRNWNLYVPLAAMLVIGLVSVLYLNRQSPNEMLFTEYFQPYPSLIPIERGDQPENDLQDALIKYEAKDYAGALASFRKVIAVQPDNGVAHFHAGIAALALDDRQAAIASFQTVIALGNAELAGLSQWYCALAYLKNDELDRARLLFEHIIAEKSVFQRNAEELLQQLNR